MLSRDENAEACICDGAKFDPNQEHPFLVHPDCPRHRAPVAGSAVADDQVEALARRLYTSRGHDYDAAVEWVRELHRDYARTAIDFLASEDQ